MSKLDTALYDLYIRHHTGMKRMLDPKQYPSWHYKSMERTFGGMLSDLPAGSRVLDVGCGAGFFLYWLSIYKQSLHPVGVDGSPPMAEIAKNNAPKADIHCEDGIDFLRRHPDSFSAIFCFEMLEHLPSGDLCLEFVEVALGALKPGGFFCAVVPNAANLAGSYVRYADLTHYRLFTSTSLLQLLEAGGFEESSILPIKPGRFSGVLRAGAEYYYHRFLGLLTTGCIHKNYGILICGLGYKQYGERI